MGINIIKKRKIFISYSRNDSVHARALYEHLKEFRDLHGDVFFDQERIKAGEKWTDVIKENINSADLFILLISPNFLNSNFCLEEEAGYALQRCLNREAKVFTVLISTCKFEKMVPSIVKGRIAFGELQAAGPFRARDQRLEAMELWKHKKNTAWTQIIERIYKAGYDIETGSSQIPHFVRQSTETVPLSVQRDNVDKLRDLIVRCDRAEQCYQLENKVRQSPMCRPFLAVVCCCEDDKPKQFVYRVESLRLYLRPSRLIAYRLAPNLLSEDESNSWYSQHFLEQDLAGWRGQNPKDVVAKLAENPTPKLYWSILMTDDTQEAEGYHRQLSQFLAAWPDLPPNSPVLVLLFFKHKPSRRDAFASLGCLPHGLADSGPQAIPNLLRVWASTLPPLLPVRRREIDEWFNFYGEDIAPLAPDGEALKNTLFDHHDQMNGLPMTMLIDLVEKHVGVKTKII